METLWIDELKTDVNSAMPADELKDYVTLSKSLGIPNPQADREELKSLLHELGLSIYPNAKVDSYLREKARTEGGATVYWCWKPLREIDKLSSMNRFLAGFQAPISRQQDVVRSSGISTVAGTGQPWRDQFDWTTAQNALAAMQVNASSLQLRDVLTASTFTNLPHGRVESGSVYGHSVPYPVLLTVKSIVDRLPDVQFFVTDYAVATPDPFLAVSRPSIDDMFIIERWDEPGFRS